MVAQLIGTSGSARSTFAGRDRAVVHASGRAADLGPPQRQALSLAVLGGGEPVRALAQRHGVSRQFCYRQADKALIVGPA